MARPAYVATRHRLRDSIRKAGFGLSAEALRAEALAFLWERYPESATDEAGVEDLIRACRYWQAVAGKTRRCIP